jgi:lysozyme
MATEPTSFDADDQVKGIDVSHHNGVIDWAKVAAAGIQFAFVKATEGGSVTDSQFQTNYSAVKSNGMIRGAYHFFHPKTDAMAQADNCLKLVPALAPGDLPPALDVEVTDDQSGSSIIAGVQLWMNTVAAALGRQPLIYTSASFWNASMGGSAQFSGHPLWVAHYTFKPQPNIPTGFGGYTIWQFTEQGQLSGISGNVDLNRFNGSLEQLQVLAGLK